MTIVFYLALVASTGTYGFAMIYGVATWSAST